MSSLHSLLARLRQLRLALDRDPTPFVAPETVARQKAEIEADIAVLEDLIRALAGEPERRDRAA
ncbi:MAG TPA: hypothetical protein VHL98_11995 [Microvirga sp.]|jgi:hypothetical protein|nr:hypothetical protein [Microvirga sp.]